jgi:hypothetical protein
VPDLVAIEISWSGARTLWSAVNENKNKKLRHEWTKKIIQYFHDSKLSMLTVYIVVQLKNKRR